MDIKQKNARLYGNLEQQVIKLKLIPCKMYCKNTLLLICEKNFFRMISLFVIFVFEDIANSSFLAYMEQFFSFMWTKHELPTGDQF